jgi:type I restriction enzyme, R subunit
MIKDQIASSIHITTEDFEYSPFNDKGGLIKVHNLFGDDLANLLQKLNQELITR